MDRRQFLTTTAATLAAGSLAGTKAFAADPVKIGFILPMTGQQQSTGRADRGGRQAVHGAERRHGRGQKIELIVKDDAGGARQRQAPRPGADRQRQGAHAGRLRHHAERARGRAARDARRRCRWIVIAAGTSIITERSPYIVRTSFTLPQSTVPMADWAAKNGIKKVVTLVSDYAPGRRCREVVQGRVHQAAAARSSSRSACRWPTRTSRRSCSARATPSRTRSSCSCRPARAAAFVKQFVERGLDKAGIKLIGPGDVTDDDLLNGMGDAVLGIVTAHLLLGRPRLAGQQGVRRRPSRRPTTACGRTSWRSAATTACT